MIQGACPLDYGIAHCDGKISAFLLGKPSTTTKIEYLAAVKPTPTPLPPIFDHLRFFLFFFGGCFFYMVVQYGMTIETIDTQSTSQITFEKYGVRGEIYRVK